MHPLRRCPRRRDSRNENREKQANKQDRDEQLEDRQTPTDERGDHLLLDDPRVFCMHVGYRPNYFSADVTSTPRTKSSLITQHATRNTQHATGFLQETNFFAYSTTGTSLITPQVSEIIQLEQLSGF